MNQESFIGKKPVILVDMDDTLADFSKMYWDVHNMLFDENVDCKSVDDWDLSKFSNRGKDAYKLFKYPGLFRNLPLKPYAREFISNIQKRMDVFVVSDTPEGTGYQQFVHFDQIRHTLNFPHSNPADDKRMWLKEHFPTLQQSNVIFCSCKWMIQGDILIDDKPETFERFTQLGRDCILIDMPHNHYIKTKWRAKDLREAEEMIYQLLHQKSMESNKSKQRLLDPVLI